MYNNRLPLKKIKTNAVKTNVIKTPFLWLCGWFRPLEDLVGQSSNPPKRFFGRYLRHSRATWHTSWVEPNEDSYLSTSGLSPVCDVGFKAIQNCMVSKRWIYIAVRLSPAESLTSTPPLFSLRWSAPPGRSRWRRSRKDPPRSARSAPPSPAERDTGGRGRRERSPGPRPPRTAMRAGEPGPCGRCRLTASLYSSAPPPWEKAGRVHGRSRDDGDDQEYQSGKTYKDYRKSFWMRRLTSPARGRKVEG